MKKSKIISISEIETTEIPNKGYNYGFTVQYESGKIRNIMLMSLSADDVTIKHTLNEQRNSLQHKSPKRRTP